jgi:hypothetical protein
MHGTNKSPDVFPHISTNVFASSSTNKIEPRNVIWPSYWGVMNEDKILPLPLDFVEQTIRPMLALDSLVNFGKWPSISDSSVTSLLDSLKSFEIVSGLPVFVTGGKVFYLENEKLVSRKDPQASSYSWRIGHTVRPASQALGINGCQDCHSVGSPFFGGEVNIESSLISQAGMKLARSNFQDNSQLYQTVFSLTFFFRPWLKFVIIFSAVIIVLVLMGYVFYGLKSLSNLNFSHGSKNIGDE